MLERYSSRQGGDMNININVISKSVGLQLFDKYYAYTQHLMKKHNFKSEYSISFSRKFKKNNKNILFAYMPDDIKCLPALENYDAVILDNAEEPLSTTTTQCVINLLFQKNNVFAQANSVLSRSHPLANKIIPFFGDIGKMRDYHLRSFYPQYYDEWSGFGDKKVIAAINGSDRAHRHYFFNLLRKKIPTIPVVENLQNQVIHETKDSLIETEEDAKFRQLVNTTVSITRNIKNSDIYYKNSVKCGINNKFGEIPPGYFIMDKYTSYQCIIFPESNWVNDELSVTEKAIKCFIANTFPFPIAGANVNKLYNQIGFSTAWNLLPHRLQEFDSVDNHERRFNLAVDSIEWLSNNRDVFESLTAREMLNQNYYTFFTKKFDLASVRKLDSIINLEK